MALTDRGGRTFKSKRGRIMPFAKMEITFYHSEKESNGYVSDVEVLQVYSFEKDGSLGRLTFGSAICELLNKLLPDEEAQSALFHYFISYLELTDKVDKRFLPALFLAIFLRILSQLGYHPSLAYCVGCSKELLKENEDFYNFSGENGGFICRTCQKGGDYYISFSPAEYKLILGLQTASLKEAATLPMSMKETTKVVDALANFLEFQTGLDSSLNALSFLEKLKNSNS